MKIFRKIDELVELLIDSGRAESSVFVSKVGWPDEEVVMDIRNLPKKGRPDYFSMLIVRRG
jgi:precorrin-2 methylase